MMRTPDGWTVEVVDIEGQICYRVKHHGSLVGGELGRRRGLYRTVGEVEQLLGASFAKLAESPS
jgi:hypothetical protein